MMDPQASPGTLPDHDTDAEEAPTSEYHTPEVIEIGKATDFVQSFTGEKYEDGYTGYTWER